MTNNQTCKFAKYRVFTWMILILLTALLVGTTRLPAREESSRRGNSPACSLCIITGGKHPASTRAHLRDLYAIDKREFRCVATNRDEYAAWQLRARPAFAELLGLPQIEADNLGHTVTVTYEPDIDEQEHFTRQKGFIATEKHVRLPFWFLKPKGAGPFPLAITPHGHNSVGWSQYAGVVPGKPDYDVAVQAVQHGFVAIAPATRGIAAGEAGVRLDDVTRRHRGVDCVCHNWQAIMAGRTAMGERVWDMMRLLDWALTLPYIDKDIVLMLGNSGGGVVTFHAAAVDPRITMAIVSCSYNNYISFTGSMRLCPCNTIPGILRFGEAWDVGALIAPRDLLTVNGKHDKLHPVAEVDHAVGHLKQLYGVAGAETHYTHRYGPEGHRFYKEIMWSWVRIRR